MNSAQYCPGILRPAGALVVVAIFLLVMPAFSAQEPNAVTSPPTTPPQLPPALQTRDATSKTTAPDPTAQLSHEEIETLRKLKMQRELQDDLLHWAQTRFWIIAIVSVVVGIFGVRALVREMLATELRDATRASAEAQAAAQSARESIKEVRAEAGMYQDLVESASTAATDVNQRLQELRTRIDAEGTRSVAAADLKIAALDNEIQELRKTVSALASDSEQSKAILRDAETRIAETRKTAETSEAEFASNADINVDIVHFDDELTRKLAKRIADAIAQKGFKVVRSSWAKGVARGKDVRIAYQPFAEPKAKSIADVVERIFDERALKSKIRFDPKDLPIFNNPDKHILVFFEKAPS